MPDNPIKDFLSNIVTDKIILVGIGNVLKADDGFGPLLIKRLRGRVRAECIDAGLSPENYIGPILKYNPDTVIFFDAVAFGGEYGQLRLIQKGQISKYGFSTHNISVKVMIEYIDDHIKANIVMFGVEPKSVVFGGEISKEVQDSISYLENLFIEFLGNEKTQA